MNQLTPKTNANRTVRLAHGAVVIALAAWTAAAAAQQMSMPAHAPGQAPIAADGVAPELEGVTIVEHLGERVPLDTAFLLDDGTTTTLGELLKPGRPLMLHMGYYKCPMLCTLVLNEAIRSLQKVDLAIGKDFDLVSISVNPRSLGNSRARRRRATSPSTSARAVNAAFTFSPPCKASRGLLRPRRSPTPWAFSTDGCLMASTRTPRCSR